MSVRNVVAVALIAFGMFLIWARARKKGDVKLAGGIWPVIEKLGDPIYILGAIMLVLGAYLLDPSLGDLLRGETPDTTTTTTTSPSTSTTPAP